MTHGHRIYLFHPLAIHRYFMSVGYRKLVSWILDLPVEDTETGYKFFDREKILEPLSRCEDKGWFWDTEIVYQAYRSGLQIKEIPCLFQRREDVDSTVNVIQDSWKSLTKLLSFARAHKAS